MPRIGIGILTAPFTVKTTVTDPVNGYLFDNITTDSGILLDVVTVNGDELLKIYYDNTTPPAAHAASHENGGSDEISVLGLSGLLGDSQTPLAHKTSHENGGGDEVSVLGLSGLLADSQTPLAHKTSHENGGGDEISVLGLSGLLGDSQTPLAHKTSHESGGSDAIKLDDFSAPDDNTDLNVSASYHGLVPKLTNSGTDCFRGNGTYVGVPPWTTYPNDVEEADAIDLVVPVGTAALDPAKRVFRIWWESDIGVETEVFNIKEREFNFITTGRAELLGDEADGAAAVGTVIGTSVEFSTEGAVLSKVQNAGVDKELTYYNGGKRFCISNTGGFVQYRALEELVTIQAAASTDTLIQIPAGSQAIVTCRVITAIPTATTFSIGDDLLATKWGTGLSVLAGTTNELVAQTNGFYFLASDTYVRITPSSTPATATGQVRVFIVYMLIGAPTS